MATLPGGNTAITRVLGEPQTVWRDGASSRRAELPDGVAAGISAQRGAGAPLARPMRDDMQAVFGTDLSAVRIHTSRQSAELNRALQATAFTVGADIFMTDSAACRDPELLAHELTHVVQQSSATSSGATRVSDPREPAEVDARKVARAVVRGTGGQMVAALGGLAGNAAVARWFGDGVVQRSTMDATTPADVKQISSFVGIDDAERLRLMNVVLDQFWVGPSDESALERIWNSFTEDQLVAFVEAHPGKWEECVDRGAELYDVCQPYQNIKTHFRNDIAALARHYLDVNEQIVNRELTAVGNAGGAPGPEQAARIAGLQAAAASLTNLQRAQEAARHTAVGWRIGDGGDVDPDWTGREVKYEVLFEPGKPPPLSEEPADLPPGDIFVHRMVPFADVQQGYDQAAEAIAQLVTANPALYGMVRSGSSAQTEAFVTTADPGAAREKLAAPLRNVLADIATTRANLGGDLDPLDLEPLAQQLFEGRAAVGGTLWTGGFRQRAARNALVGHKIDRVFKRALLQEVQVLALMLAPLTSGASLLLLLGTATAAAGLQAFGSYREAQVLGAAEGSSVRPGTELVAPGTAEQARLIAQADLIAFGLALLTLGAEGFAAWRAGAKARRAATQERIRLHHGTEQTGYEALGPLDQGRIDVRHAAGTHQDLGQGFYLTMDAETGSVYAFRRGQERGGGLQHVLTFEIPKSDLGVVVDIRPGGNFRAQWEVFLNERPPLPGGFTPPGFETNRGMLRLAPEQRGAVFEEFLKRHGIQGADTIIAPLGDDVFTGITNPSGTTTQVCIRSQRVADRLNEQIRTGR